VSPVLWIVERHPLFLISANEVAVYPAFRYSVLHIVRPGKLPLAEPSSPPAGPEPAADMLIVVLKGYTSLGGTQDTHPNPQLKKGDENGARFRPAYELMADDEERLGRDGERR